MELYNPGAPFRYTSEWNPTRTHPVTGVIRPHRGEDWGAPSGTPIPAAGAGKVVYKGSMSGYGNMVVLEHAIGAEIVHTLYAHMRAPSPLAIGSSVAKDAAIGECGNTGVGTGAHLHFEVLRNGTKGQPNLARGHATVNPREFDISRLTDPDSVGAVSPESISTDAIEASGPWQFPIRKPGGSQFKDADELFSALEAETSGHYLLGGHNFWHGGIHITNLSAPQCIRDEPVRCMGDGVVVAYRLNRDYLTSEFAGASATETLKYSSSFCLVRHDYKSPANTQVTPSTRNELTFYSLYMHLLPFDRYSAVSDNSPLPRIRMIASGFSARSGIKDAINCEEYGSISAGAEIEILEEHSDQIHAKGKLIKGVITGRTENQEFWFAYKKNGNAYPRPNGDPSWKEVLPPERTRPGYWKGKVRAVVAGTGLTLRHPPATLAHGAQAGLPIGVTSTHSRNEGLVLCTNSMIEFDSDKVLNLKLGNKTLRMAECTFVPNTSGVPTGLKAHSFPVPDSFWACVEDVSPNRFVQWQSLIPSAFDQVVPVGTAIKAGDPIGYFGLNENLAGPNGGVSGKYQVHVELFSADPGIEDFLKNKAGVKDGKQYIYLPAATVLSKKSPQVGSVEFLSEHFVELAKVASFRDIEEWYEITVIDSGESKTGLLKKESARLISQHDWETLGFRVIRESNQTSDGFLDPDDMPDFFKEIYNELDTLGNNDGNVTAEDLPIALKNVRLREHWSKLIADHPTEWKSKSDTSKWARLDKILEDYPSVLKHEKERIDKLVFWDELSGDAKISDSGGVVKHFHPIAFIGNIIAVPGLSTCKNCGRNISLTYGIMKKIVPEGVADDFLNDFVMKANELFPKYGVNTCSQVVHLLGQGKHETQRFTAFRESLNYSRRSYDAERLYRMAPTAINNGFTRLGMTLSREEKLLYIDQHLIANDAGYGRHSFGSSQYPNNDYRGRGLLHLTHYSSYRACAIAIGVSIDASPVLVESDTKIIIETGLWFWKENSIGNIADNGAISMDAKVRAVTAKINTGLKALEERVTFTKAISAIFKTEFDSCSE